MYIRPSFDTKDEAEQKEPYATILHEFRQALPKFDMCIAIGYSFRDRHISEELVKFAKNGGILFLIDPRATTNFQKYALGERPTPRKKKWRAKDGLYRMPFVSSNRNGIVYALNEKLATDSVNDIIGVIKPLIKKITPSRKTTAGGR